MKLDDAPSRSWLDAVMLAALWLALLGFVSLTWAQWPTLTADGSRELYVPFQILHGKLLYRDFYYLYGPVAPYTQAALLKLLGARLEVLYLASALHLAAIMGVLYAIARHVLGPFASAIAVWLFFTHFALGRDLYGYMWPYAFAATYAVLFGLFLLLALLRHMATGWLGWLLLGGVAWGLSLVTKLEYGVAATGVAVAYMGARLLFRASLPETRGGKPGGALTLARWGLEVLSLALPAIAVAGAAAMAILAAVDLQTVLESVWPTKLMAMWSSGGQWHGDASTWKEALRFLLLAGLPLAFIAGHQRLLRGDKLPWSLFLATALLFVVFTFGKDDRVAFLWEFGHRFWVGPSFVVLFLALGLGVVSIVRDARTGRSLSPVAIAWGLIAGYGLLVCFRTLFRGMNEYTGYQAPVAMIAWVAIANTWLPGWLGLRPLSPAEADAPHSPPGPASRPMAAPALPPGYSRATRPFLVLLLIVLSGRHLADAYAAYAPPDTMVSGPAGTVLAEPTFGEPFNAARTYIETHIQPGERFIAAPMEKAFYLFLGQDNPLKEDQLFFGYLTTDDEQRDFIRRMRKANVRYVLLSSFGYPNKAFGKDYMQLLASWLEENASVVARYGDERYNIRVLDTGFSPARPKIP